MLTDRDEGYTYLMDISDAINQVITGWDNRAESQGTNKLTISSTYKLHTSGETADCKELVIEDLEVGYLPDVEVNKLRHTESFVMKPASGLSLRSGDEIIKKFADSEYDVINAASKAWLEAKDDGENSKAAAADLEAALLKADAECGSCGCEFDPLYKEALAMKDLFTKQSVWIFGGDGWAYDIGFGGLDHVIASGEDVNIMVFDTEVYSNTGGQASKATPTGSIAQFAAAGKATGKKDLAGIAMSYGNVYVAQVAMGADYNQCLKAIIEAEAYHGPSIVIGYAPCINHGIKGGMGNSISETKKAVEAGYWFNYRFNPAAEQPFALDSKAPAASYNDFILSETRYSALTRSMPERAKELFERAANEAKARYNRLSKLGELYSQK